jgi:hypothetical protein
MQQVIQLNIIPLKAPVEKADFAFYTLKQDGYLDKKKTVSKKSNVVNEPQAGYCVYFLIRNKMKRQLINANQAWLIVEQDAKQFQQCISITGIVYELKIVNEIIYFTAPSRNGGKPEEISKTAFFEFYNIVKGMEVINTNTTKNKMPSGLYKKRSLLMALLKSTEVIK